VNTAEQAKARQLQGYLARRVAAAADDIAPQLLDYISGSSEEEIDAAIETAKAKSAALVARARQGQVLPTDNPAVVNVREGFGEQPVPTADEISSWSLDQYARRRGELGVHKPLLDFLAGQ
jgi:hypothetical protein